jgi:hypothetical protein
MPRLLAIALVFAACNWHAKASAFCRTTTCDHDGCSRDRHGCLTSGVPLSWRPGCLQVGLELHTASEAGFDPTEIVALLQRSCASWSDAECGGQLQPGLCLIVEPTCGASTAPISVRFWSDDWPYDDRNVALADTRVDFAPDGAIRHAEININAGYQPLSVGDTGVSYDLQTTLTHELGHALGLDHSDRLDAAMNSDARFGELSARELSADDETAICQAYPPAAMTGTGVEEGPAAVACESPLRIAPGGCSASQPAPTKRSGALVMVGMLLSLVGARRRLRRRPARPPAISTLRIHRAQTCLPPIAPLVSSHDARRTYGVQARVETGAKACARVAGGVLCAAGCVLRRRGQAQYRRRSCGWWQRVVVIRCKRLGR